ncbi:HTTM domain-containing protein [Pendulispora brunnea]|uniref:HTTM domain-containing protein n=1 Tax=Pendulispora brunnea TaxID=2905690 RepID=A0ABZ2K635_9BACT
MSLFRRLRAAMNETADAHVLGVIRIAIGGMLLVQTLAAANGLLEQGYFGDVFHMPFIPEAWVPSRSIYVAMLAARVLLAVLVVIGHWAPQAALASALLGLYTLLCDRLGYHHNRYALFCFAFLLAFTPCDRTLCIPRSAEPRIGPRWAVRLAQIQVALIYLASAGSKLLDDDWRDGRVILDRFARYGSEAVARGIPPRVVEAFSQPIVTSALAKLAISTELFLAVALFSRRLRVFALWWGLMFHLTIEITSKVELFTWLTLTSYAFFVTPDTHARKFFFDPSRPRGQWIARIVAGLDWFARFEIRPWTPDHLRKGHTIVIMRRDGSRATGLRALTMIARCTPLLFPLWAPLALLASFTRGGEANARL